MEWEQEEQLKAEKKQAFKKDRLEMRQEIARSK